MNWVALKSGYACLNKGWHSMKRRKKIETSKLLLWMLLSGLGIITISAITFCYLFGQSEPLVALIENVAKLVTIAVGFYFWKAKNENLHKYKKDDKIGDINE